MLKINELKNILLKGLKTIINWLAPVPDYLPELINICSHNDKMIQLQKSRLEQLKRCYVPPDGNQPLINDNELGLPSDKVISKESFRAAWNKGLLTLRIHNGGYDATFHGWKVYRKSKRLISLYKKVGLL